MKDSSLVQTMGFYQIEIPRENLGKVLINLSKNEAIVKSAETVLVIPGKQFAPLKFTFEKIQPPGSYLTSTSDNISGASITSSVTSVWDKFYLVTRYLTKDSLGIDKKLIQ